MTRVICSVCKREVNGRVPAGSASVFPYRHLPPEELGQVSHQHEDGTTSWFGGGKWCMGTWVNAEETEQSRWKRAGAEARKHLPK